MDKEQTLDKHPWLTVIVPVYNAERHLQKCLDSILGQSFQNYEVILVDDGSIDHSSTICQASANKDSRVKYLRKENGGPFQARVFGVEHAEGEYITFCDADDYYASSKAFQTFYKMFYNNDYEALQFGHIIKYNHLSRRSSTVKQTLKLAGEEFLRDEYPLFLCSNKGKSHLTLNVWNKVYKRKLFSSFPTSLSAERLFWGDDLVLNLYALKECKSMAVIPDELYIYRDTSGGTTQYSKNEMRDLDKIKKYQLLFLNEIDVENKEKLLENLHLETAHWLALWVKAGIGSIEEEELQTLVEEALALPQIIAARDFFMNLSKWHWEEIDLLRHYSTQEYIDWAKKNNAGKRSVKERLISIYKKI